MGYIEQRLLPGETILVKAKIHWGAFISPAIAFTLGLISIALSLISETLSAFGCVGWIVVLFGIIELLRAATSYFTTEFGLTDRRVIAKSGALRQVSLEVLLEKVESLSISQPLLGRLLGYGSIVVAGSGGTQQKLRNIAQPTALRCLVNAQIISPSH